ncbi:peptidoglycan editing factor PgeF [Clostridium pasteurianum]|uniref:peptidoglycan editing factor PgeF n=1 Tax=Clostridium pasteurianum TaxID=1501 RepID=UPI0022609B5A|nr:peptidoglycan editing factor PgeF [Clostridium pasteurianum]UZW12415.1 peptidoglycan editing factor PgeF [Clostridium pasteurianum]
MDIVIDNYKFINFKDDNININFSTAKNNLDFNINTSEGLNNLENIKQWFGVQSVGYLRQTHSDKICLYDGVIHEGDAIITDKPHTAIGIFTADCVPVLIYSKTRAVIAAVHSGWKGTLSQIVYKTIKKIISLFSINIEDIRVYIGPHNRECCYEFGEDVAEQFYNKDIYRNLKIYENGKLNLETCIKKQITETGVPEKNIKSLNICTYCNEEYDLFSYRKQKINYGRMYSFIYIK